MPGPWSLDLERPRARRRGATRTSTGVPGGVCTSALPTRLADDLAQPAVVAGDDRRGPSTDAVIGRSGSTARASSHRVVGERAEVDRRALERAALVEAGELQQVVDERAHAHRLLLGAAHRLVESSSGSSSPPAR